MKYFLHDTSAFDDEKVAELFLNFGYEGIGLFFTILEKIAKQEKPIKTKVLKSQLHVRKKLEKCWNFLENIELISTKNGETFNINLLNFSEKYQIKKEKNAKRISEWRKSQIDTENVTCNEHVRNARKVNRNKVNKKKVNTIPENDKIILSNLQKIFLEFYNNKFNRVYQVTKADIFSFRSLLKKYRIEITNSGKNETENMIADAFKITLYRITDKWIINNLSPSIICSKFNQIINEIKNGKNNNGISENELTSIVADAFADANKQ